MTQDKHLTFVFLSFLFMALIVGDYYTTKINLLAGKNEANPIFSFLLHYFSLEAIVVIELITAFAGIIYLSFKYSDSFITPLKILCVARGTIITLNLIPILARFSH